MAEFERQFNEAASEGAAAIASFTIVDSATGNGDTPAASDDAATAEEASRLIEPIVQQLAQLGPAGWEEFSAEFAFTVSSQIAQLQFWSEDRTGLVPVPQSVAELVSQQREVAARMPAGPWWRLLLTVTNRGETTVDYDYGDEPFPDDQLVAPEHYRNDLETYPREHVPVWLAGYVAGPAAQGRDPRQAAAAVAADAAAGRTADRDRRRACRFVTCGRAGRCCRRPTPASDRAGGPRIYPGYGWYESDRRSGSTLFVLPGDRAVLSGGKWDSELLDAAYNGGAALARSLRRRARLGQRQRAQHPKPQRPVDLLLLVGEWPVVSGRHRHVRRTRRPRFLPIQTPDDTIRAMVSQTGPGTEDACEALLTAAVNRSATPADCGRDLRRQARRRRRHRCQPTQPGRTAGQLTPKPCYSTY